MMQRINRLIRLERKRLKREKRILWGIVLLFIFLNSIMMIKYISTDQKITNIEEKVTIIEQNVLNLEKISPKQEEIDENLRY